MERPPLTKEQEVDFQMGIYLKDLKSGDVVTLSHIVAIEHFLGGLLEQCRNLKKRKLTFDPDPDNEGQMILVKDEIL